MVAIGRADRWRAVILPIRMMKPFALLIILVWQLYLLRLGHIHGLNSTPLFFRLLSSH